MANPPEKTTPEKASAFSTPAIEEAKTVFTQEDLAATGFDAERDLGYPGQFPFTRGIQPTMYRGRLWTMRQYAGMGDTEESNARYKFLLANGTAGLSAGGPFKPSWLEWDLQMPSACLQQTGE